MHFPLLSLTKAGHYAINSPFQQPTLQSLGNRRNSFTALLGTLAKQTRNSLQNAEQISIDAASNKADPQQVAINVVHAKAAVEQFAALTKSSVAAFTEIMHISI